MQIFEKVPMTKAMISLGAVVKKKFTRIFIMTNVSNNRGGGQGGFVVVHKSSTKILSSSSDFITR